MLKINLKSSVPLYEQISHGIEIMIRTGDLSPGDSLPTIRAFASQLDIAINTVARAYMELESSGLIISRGRKGTFISDEPEILNTGRKKVLKKAILQLFRNGFSRKEIDEIYHQNMKEIFE